MTTIASMMQAEPLTLRPDTPMREAAAALVAASAPAAPVTDQGGALLGVLSQKDCFRSALNAAYYRQWSGCVADYMSREVVTLPADTDLASAAEAFLDHPFRAFPVVQGKALVGVLTRSDLLAALLRLG